MIVKDKSLTINVEKTSRSWLAHMEESVLSNLRKGEFPVRFVVNKTGEQAFHCEVTIVSDLDYHSLMPPSIFEFRKRQHENNNHFNAAMLIPTGINCEIGGHAGDATPVARLLASICDNLIIHPNIVNASDINELTENCLVVEGSVLARLLMGTVGLQKVRANRVLVVIEDMDNPAITEASVNSVSAARATLGLNYVDVVCLKQPGIAVIQLADSGRASGTITDMNTLLTVLKARYDSYDAVAIVTALGGTTGQSQLMYDYYVLNTINPWGGIEAMFTHTLSLLLNKPAMHSPIMESDEPLNYGLVDPRKASEVVSRTYMHCILKGLHRSPKIICNESVFGQTGVLSVEDIHCLIIPDGVLGLPTLAALEQGIPVIAVRENRNLMQNNLGMLSFAAGKYFAVDNYLEAAGIMAALKAGVEPSAIRRPISETHVSKVSLADEVAFVS